MNIIAASISRYRAVLSTLVLLLIAGKVSYNSIPKESEPDITIPIIIVSMKHEGISPEDAERLLLRPMETEFKGLGDVKEMRSSAYDGGATVTLEFNAGFDVSKALNDVREKVDNAKSELPNDTEEPTVKEINLSQFPVINVMLAGDVSERLLLRLAKDLQEELEGIRTVLKVDIAGDRDEVVEILVEPKKMELYQFNLGEVFNIVSSNNTLIAAGALDTGSGRFNVKVPGLVTTLDDILNMPLKVDGDKVIQVKHIAEVKPTFKDKKSYARVNGKPSVVLSVSKRTGENIIETIDNVKKVVNEVKQDWPGTVSVEFMQDKSEKIRVMLNDLQNSVLLSVLLVFIVIVAVLGVRTGILVGISIPGSFLTAILVLNVLGLTVNMVVLFSLILSVGMLVDGAIVVTEYAERKMAEGSKRKEAYIEASTLMGPPIIASTITTLAAFFPLLFWPGIVGEFMKFLPITLITTLTASLLMALIFVPTLGAFIGKSEYKIQKIDLEVIEKENSFKGKYVKFLKFLLKRSGYVIFVSIFLLVFIWILYSKLGKGVEFFPKVEPEFGKVIVRARGNLAYEEQKKLVQEVEEKVLKYQKELDSVFTQIGDSAGGEEATEDTIGVINLEFTDWHKRRSARVIVKDILKDTESLMGIQTEISFQEAGPPTGKDIQIQLKSTNGDLLSTEAKRILDKLKDVKGLLNFEDSYALPGIEWKLMVDRAQAIKFGADIRSVGQAVKLVTNGIKVTDYKPADSTDEVDVLIRYDRKYRSIQELDRIRITTPKGLVSISNFVEKQAKPKTGTLYRFDGKRVFDLKFDVEEGVLVSNKLKLVKEILDDLNLRGVDVSFKGQEEKQKESGNFLVKAFGFAIFLMWLILVVQFNNFYYTLLILFAVIMSTVGVLLGLLLKGQAFGIVMSGIGVIALAGIVVNNNIVLIDTFQRLEKQMPKVDAILHTSLERIRPVLLTTVTTILGLIPMVFQINIDFMTKEISVGAPSTQWWVQLSTAIAFGLTFATILTLVITPCALYFPEIIKKNVDFWKKKFF